MGHGRRTPTSNPTDPDVTLQPDKQRALRPQTYPVFFCFHGPGPGSTKFPVLLADGMWDFSGLLFGLQHSPQVGLFASGV